MASSRSRPGTISRSTSCISASTLALSSRSAAALARCEREEIRNIVGDSELCDGEDVEERGEVVLQLADPAPRGAVGGGMGVSVVLWAGAICVV
jgi:hypothetical protein